jgi:H+-translocating NAD(P) transhydrogenase
MVAAMKPGSVIVDLAAEAGGNCEATVPGRLAMYNGVKVIGSLRLKLLSCGAISVNFDSGYTDLPSRLPMQASTLYSNNIAKFLLSLSIKEKDFYIDLSDEVARGSVVTLNGEVLPPAPRPAPPAAPKTASKETPGAKETGVVALTPWKKARREVATVTAGLGTALVLGKATGPVFMGNMFTFGLAGLVGYQTVWGVVPALHSPLMSVTNAISGMTIFPPQMCFVFSVHSPL